MIRGSKGDGMGGEGRGMSGKEKERGIERG